MSYEISDHVSGLSDEQVVAMALEAEKGYDVDPQAAEPNPRLHRLQIVPEDLIDAIDARARRDRQSPEAIVRQALTAYLRTA